MSISREIALARDFAQEAELLKANYGRTSLYSTSALKLDSYLGGGFGRENAYEVVLLFGPTKIGKSTVALNFAGAAIKQGQRVGIMNLEDDSPDVFLRLAMIVGKQATEDYILRGDTVHLMAPSAVGKPWKLTELIELIESWFTDRKIDLLVLDHLQFAFEAADFRGENEYQAQRTFMRELNGLMRRVKKTIILVSHIGKATGAAGVGVNKIVGSSGIAAASTKLIELSKDGSGQLWLQEWGSRFTATPDLPHPVRLDNLRLSDAL